MLKLKQIRHTQCTPCLDNMWNGFDCAVGTCHALQRCRASAATHLLPLSLWVQPLLSDSGRLLLLPPALSHLLSWPEHG